VIPRAYKTEAIVLKRDNFSETDRLVTILTPHHGKIRCIAKGIKRIHSRKAPHLELFNVISAFIVNGKTLGIITEVSTVETFRNIRSDLTKIAYAYKAVEEVDRLCAEGAENAVIYNLLRDILWKIEQSYPDKLLSLSENFTLQLLWDLGFLPRAITLSGNALERFLERVLERTPKSAGFLTKVVS